MKNIFLFVLVVVATNGFSQITNHFENPNSRWFVYNNFINSNQENPSHLGVQTTIWGVDGDTLIDNIYWLKLYSSQDSSFQEGLNFRGLLRSEDSKVYYKETAISESRLLYDFSLEVGDSVEYTFLYNQDGNNLTATTYLKVIDVEMIAIQGELHKQFTFSEPLSIGNFPITMGAMVKEVWVDGVGSLHNPIFPIYPFTVDTEWGEKVEVTCSFIGQELFYHNENYEQCYNFDVLEVGESSKETVTIYPNPADDLIIVEATDSYRCHVLVLDNLGKILVDRKVDSKNNCVNISKLPQGVYTIQVKTDSSLLTSKFIKK